MHAKKKNEKQNSYVRLNVLNLITIIIYSDIALNRSVAEGQTLFNCIALKENLLLSGKYIRNNTSLPIPPS